MKREYRKACDCVGATASGPRCFIGKPEFTGETWKVSAGWSYGPVCDKCEKPWEVIYEGVQQEVTEAEQR